MELDLKHLGECTIQLTSRDLKDIPKFKIAGYQTPSLSNGQLSNSSKLIPQLETILSLIYLSKTTMASISISVESVFVKLVTNTFRPQFSETNNLKLEVVMHMQSSPQTTSGICNIPVQNKREIVIFFTCY